MKAETALGVISIVSAVWAACGVLRAAEGEAASGPPADPPYPPSTAVRSLRWDDQVVRIGQGAGDNWAITWAEKDVQVTSYGDGKGFSGRSPRLSLGFARVTGDPPNHRGEDLLSDADTPEGGGPKGIKASGLLMVEGVLYLFARNYRVGDNLRHARLAWSSNGGKNWTWADWHFSGTFGCPEFVQFGMDYRGARDGYVYVVSQDNDSAYEYAADIVLARVQKQHVRDRDRYEFLAGLGDLGQPTWSADLSARKPIFHDPKGTQRISMTYNAALRRYFLTTSHRNGKGTHTAALGIFDAPEPWGPWTTVYYDDHWSGSDVTYHHKFPTKWMSADGRTMWLLFSGLKGGNYAFCLRRATLETASAPPQPAGPPSAPPGP